MAHSELDRRIREVGAANTALTLSSPPIRDNKLKQLTHVFVAYSANVSLDVTITLNSGLLPAHDVTLSTLTFSANRFGVYIPDVPIPLDDGDVVDVLAPAGGGSITAAIEIKIRPRIH